MWGPVLAFLIVPSLVLTAGVGAAGSVGRSAAAAPTPQLWLPTVIDGGHVDLLSAGKVLSVMTDHAAFVSGNPYTRTYSISVGVTVSLPLFSAHVESFPLAMWGDPTQYPGGVDALPPLSYWSWTVYHGTTNDTANWTMYPTVSSLMRTIPWSWTNYTVVGKVFPRFNLQVGAVSPTGGVAPNVGYVATDVLSPASNASSDPDFLNLAQSLHPGLIRFGTTSIGMNVTWNSTYNLPVFRWRAFDSILAFAKSIPSPVLMSLPVGTWGDGNNLPSNMPLNLSYTMNFYGATGYFPTVAAYTAFISGLVQHVNASGENVTYWSIGNEVPRYTASEVDEYIQLFNAAASTIHQTFPHALVGSDVMMDPKYIRQFALSATGVGFLSFHYYPATGICMNGGTYCPPAGGALGTTDPTIIDGPNYIGHLTLWDAPALAQMVWRNLTGDTLPVLDAETNLNHMGGQYTVTGGTDPRIPTLFAASWLDAMLLQSVAQNLSTFLYYGFTGPAVQTPSNTSQYGGWGFQMTSEGTHDNDTLYAPYWGLWLWAEGVSPGAAALSTTGGDPAVVEAQAFRSGSQDVNILIVNRVNTTIKVELNVTGANEVPQSLQVLGPLSYKEVFNPTTQTERLVRSTVANFPVPPANPVRLTLKGYSVALLREKYVPGVPPVRAAESPAADLHHPRLHTASTRGTGTHVGPRHGVAWMGIGFPAGTATVGHRSVAPPPASSSAILGTTGPSWMAAPAKGRRLGGPSPPA